MALASDGESLPSWVCDVLAVGCPVIAVESGESHDSYGFEASQGIVRVPLEAGSILRAIESLLVDRVRLISLLRAGKARLGMLPEGDGAERFLAAFSANSETAVSNDAPMTLPGFMPISRAS